MHHMRFVRNKLPVFFAQHELEMLLKPSKKIEVLTGHLTRAIRDCKQIDLACQNEREKLAAYGQETDLERDTLSKVMRDMGNLATRLESIEALIAIGTAMRQGKLYAWEPPKDEQGNVDWQRIVHPPKMQPVTSAQSIQVYYPYNTKPSEPQTLSPFSKDRNPEWNPGLLLFGAPHRRFPKSLTVESLCDYALGEPDILNKAALNDALQEIGKLSRLHAALFKENQVPTAEILAFFNEEKVKALRHTGNHFSLS